eukprot:scaffold23594_cov23-Tisochrysis_lutea.AAC.1
MAAPNQSLAHTRTPPRPPFQASTNISVEVESRKHSVVLFLSQIVGVVASARPRHLLIYSSNGRATTLSTAADRHYSRHIIDSIYR